MWVSVGKGKDCDANGGIIWLFGCTRWIVTTALVIHSFVQNEHMGNRSTHTSPDHAALLVPHTLQESNPPKCVRVLPQETRLEQAGSNPC